jgi:hypothetical protein
MSVKPGVTIQSQWHGKEISIMGKKAVGMTSFDLGLIVEGEAKLLSAVNYGYLAASFHTRSDEKSTELESPSKYAKATPPEGHDVKTFRKIKAPNDPNQVLVGSAVDYAPHVEFGTIKSNAQPALRPALDLAKGKKLTVLEKNGRMVFKEYLK